jgi:hypothetical protein
MSELSDLAPERWTATDAAIEQDKLYAPATQRNRDVITGVLKGVLPRSGVVLEIASGSGEHVVHFAGAFPALTWQPSDPDPAALASIGAWTSEAGVGNVLPPVRIDAAAAGWPMARADAVLCINMVHISPWAATEGLMKGSRMLLSSRGILYLYGPFIRTGVETAPSNLSFDLSLRQRDANWGIRNLEDVTDLAKRHGLACEAVVEMPANNLSVIFRKG